MQMGQHSYTVSSKRITFIHPMKHEHIYKKKQVKNFTGSLNQHENIKQ